MGSKVVEAALHSRIQRFEDKLMDLEPLQALFEVWTKAVKTRMLKLPTGWLFLLRSRIGILIELVPKVERKKLISMSLAIAVSLATMFVVIWRSPPFGSLPTPTFGATRLSQFNESPSAFGANPFGAQRSPFGTDVATQGGMSTNMLEMLIPDDVGVQDNV
ncbi:hypothetical protein Tco_0233669 [Tanacetum coccineum]